MTLIMIGCLENCRDLLQPYMQGVIGVPDSSVQQTSFSDIKRQHVPPVNLFDASWGRSSIKNSIMSRPLLSDRSPSENSEEQAHREDEALLGNRDDIHDRITHYTFREIGLFIWAVLATAAVIVLAALYSHHQTIEHIPGNGSPNTKRNLIFMVCSTVSL